MATTRKRTSGFPNPEEKEETPSFDELLESVKEVIEAEDQAETPVLLPKPFIEETIVPTEDLGPRFLEQEAPAPAPKKVQPPELKPAPKRQPRNVPKFSRLR